MASILIVTNKQLYKMETQRRIIRQHLQKRNSITSMEAFKLFGITRLSAIIHHLRNVTGMNIHGNPKTVKNRQKKEVKICEYSLKKIKR